MRTTEPIAKSAFTPKAGIFALLSSLPRVKGTSAPKVSQGSAAPSLVKPALLFLPALVLAFLAFTVTPALAAAPEKPEALPPTEAKATTALLNGTLDPGKTGGPGSFELNTYEFVYRQSASECKGAGEVKTTEGLSLGEGKQAVSQGIGGLTANTQYTVCLVAHNEAKTEEAVSLPVTFKTALPPEAPESVELEEAQSTVLKVKGVVNPKAPGNPGSFEFLYKRSATECENESTVGGPSTGAKGEVVKGEATGLLPGTKYTFCLRARNEAGEESALSSPPVSFTTLGAQPTIVPETTSSTEVTATSAKLNAQVDPGGAETTYHFEYDTSPYTTSAPHGQSTPESAPVGSDNSEHPAAAAIDGLQPGTTYHYRVVATNSKSPVGGTPSPDKAFTTQSAGKGAALPDGRAYELVSPPGKDGAEVLGIAGGGLALGGIGATQASEDGKGVTYGATGPVGAGPHGNAGTASQVLSTRGVGGWSSQDIQPPHPNPPTQRGLGTGEYLQFSTDLSRAILMQGVTEPPLAPEIHQEVKHPGLYLPNGHEIYVRDNGTSAFRAVQTSEPLPEIAFEGASPDLAHVVFEGPAGLDPKHPSAGGLYEWTGGQTALVSVSPTGEPAGGLSLLGRDTISGFNGLRLTANVHAVSDDGSRVVWSNEGNLYTRDMATGVTTLIGAGEFETASSDGSRVFYNNGDLIVLDVADKTQTDLGSTVQGSQEGTGFHEPFVGANEAGTAVYEFSPAVLTKVANGQGEKAAEGAKNLYLVREMPLGGGSWSTTFITAGAEEGTTSQTSSDAAPFAANELSVSPNWRYLAFMSRQQSLTGYDNRDANSGALDEEVYLYDAEANRLVCVSCDPTGARPVGEYHSEAQFPAPPLDQQSLWEGRWLAASIPGWTSNGEHMTTGHQPRSLSDSGRLFFTSSDALVPHDVNGRADVYEYEPTGVGGCVAPGFGLGASVVRDLAESGCVGLISAGTGSDDSVFFDASANGDDVFFTTQDGLVSEDKDGTADVYDARVCTQTEPCPSSLAVAPACTTTDACRVAPSPQPGVFAAPASATFAGAGNATPAPTVTKKTTKKKTVKCKKGFAKNKKGKCVKKPKKKSRRAKKASNDRRTKR